jgi:hypothetical protein
MEAAHTGAEVQVGDKEEVECWGEKLEVYIKVSVMEEKAADTEVSVEDKEEVEVKGGGWSGSFGMSFLSKCQVCSFVCLLESLGREPQG